MVKRRKRTRLSRIAEKWKKEGRSRLPQLWLEKIEQISDEPLKIKAACIVWYDFFGIRKMMNAWHHLDGLKNSWKPKMPVDRSRLVETLVSVGYPQVIAERRMR